MNTQDGLLQNYLYDLPDEKIAKYPLTNREDSKLLVYSEGRIKHSVFKKCMDAIPDDSLLFFNNTKVIAARLYFIRSTGSRVEVFLTEPILPHSDIQLALEAKNTCVWHCMIGNLKKWKDDEILSLDLGNSSLSAKLKDRKLGEVEFCWNDDSSFSEIIEKIGHIPLPPYMNRSDEEGDKDRYQTVFSKLDGAVAAPTAGLHFSESIMNELSEQGVKTDYLTLHVSAGTFRPIKVNDYKNHDMHNEQVIVSRCNVENILNRPKNIIAVGTTALRCLESLYWYGAMLVKDDKAPFFVEQNTAYEEEYRNVSVKDAMLALISKMDSLSTDVMKGETEIFIHPSYEFKIVDGLFTNFHQPGSTLILLIAALLGDKWKEIYNEALERDYRFLSYGDTSLLLK